MARFVVFNGVTIIHPGGASRVDVSALAQTGVGISGIIGLIGESDGGPPNTLIVIDEPNDAKAIFGSGPLADAVRLVFEPSADPRVTAGAFRVIAIKTNQSTRATLTLTGQAALGTFGENQMVLTSTTYGVEANKTNWVFGEDVLDANKFQTQVALAPVTEATSDIAGYPLMNLSFKGPDEPIIVTDVTHTDGLRTATGLGADAFTIPDTTTPATVLVDMFVRILAAPGVPTVVGEYRRITTVNVGASIVVGGGSIGFAAPIPSGATYEIVQLRCFDGSVQAVVSNVAGVNGVKVNITNTVSVSGNDLRDVNASAFYVGKMLRVVDGEGAGQLRTIKSMAGGATDVVLTLTDDELFDPAPEVGDRIALIDVISAVATITGASGVATTLVTTTSLGTSVVAIPVAATDKTISLTAAKSINDIIQEFAAALAVPAQPNAGSNYIAYVGGGRNGAVAGACTLFDFDSGNASIDLRADRYLAPTTRARFNDNLNQLIISANANSSLITVARAITGVTPALVGAGVPRYNVTPLYLGGAVFGGSTNTNWQNGFDELLKTRINIVVPLISENLSGGSTATLNSVHAQLVSHVQTAQGVGKSERNAYASMLPPGTGSLAAVLNRVIAINNKDVALLFQSPTVLNVNSEVVELPPWAHACLAAGMQAGAPLGEPSTFKYLRAESVNNNSTALDPLDRTVSNQLLLGGVMFSEFVRGRGNRWVRGLTTSLIDDNLARTDISVNNVLNNISYELRTAVENEYTGVRTSRATPGTIKSFVTNFMEGYRTDGIIVDSQDPVTGTTVKAYYNVRITISGDIARIKLCVFPVTGINFELVELFAQLPVLVA